MRSEETITGEDTMSFILSNDAYDFTLMITLWFWNSLLYSLVYSGKKPVSSPIKIWHFSSQQVRINYL